MTTGISPLGPETATSSIINVSASARRRRRAVTRSWRQKKGLCFGVGSSLGRGLGSIAVSRLCDARPRKTVREAATQTTSVHDPKTTQGRTMEDTSRVLKTAGVPGRNSCLGPR